MTAKQYDILSKACEIDDKISDYEFELQKAKSMVHWFETKLTKLKEEKAILSEELMKSCGIKRDHRNEEELMRSVNGGVNHK